MTTTTGWMILCVPESSAAIVTVPAQVAHPDRNPCSMSNPFASSIVSDQRGVFGDSRRIRAGFLYRVIQIDAPVSCQLVYDGWWFRQKIEIDGQRAWFQISWLTIRRHIEFTIPASVDPRQPAAVIEIEFGRSLGIRRFRVWIDGQIAYDEVN